MTWSGPFRKESDEYEVWYTETSDPNEEQKMKVFNKFATLREISWWLNSVKEANGDYSAKIHIIREHVKDN